MQTSLIGKSCKIHHNSRKHAEQGGTIVAITMVEGAFRFLVQLETGNLFVGHWFDITIITSEDVS